ncbi:TPA: peptidase S24 [Pseudomonas aeruginosa]|nr:peptidase S24 [Pseudomonas aeruginosa]
MPRYWANLPHISRLLSFAVDGYELAEYCIYIQQFEHAAVDSVTILGQVDSSSTPIPFFLPSVPAGFPSPAQDHLEQRISLDELFGLHRPQIYLVRVGGNSLQGLGIHDEDLVLIDKALTPRKGDVIVACLNGEPLLKILDGDKHQVILQSANPQYPPRYVLEAEDFQVWGVYIGLCRAGRASG